MKAIPFQTVKNNPLNLLLAGKGEQGIESKEGRNITSID